MFYYVWAALFGLNWIGVAMNYFSQKAGQLKESLADSSFVAFQGRHSVML